MSVKLHSYTEGKRKRKRSKNVIYMDYSFLHSRPPPPGGGPFKNGASTPRVRNSRGFDRTRTCTYISDDFPYMLRALAAGARRCIRTMSAMTTTKPEVVFILGGPGAGKGTLCRYIVERYGYVHLSAGDLLREERVKPGSEYGELIETHIRNGTIVPVEITCSLIDRAMQTSGNPHCRFLIDGFPRNQDNLDGWNKMMADKVILKGVIFCECNQEVCTRRCLNRGASGSGRSDDNEESLVLRHQTYLKNTLPIIEMYNKQGLVYNVNSMKTPEEVFHDVAEYFPKIGW